LYLFILESIGTSELLLIGVVALIFLGPRRMPEIAKKLGKIMNEFRGTANEFKDTWQREVNFEEEAKALDLNSLDEEPIARVEAGPKAEPETAATAPAIKEIDPAKFEELKASAAKKKSSPKKLKKEPQTTNGSSDKKNWL
jgi:Tat protein translocase TatB subunit